MLRFIAFISVLFSAPFAMADGCERAELMLGEASRIRGLAIKKPVECRALSQKEYFEELSELIKKDLKPKRLEAEERAFKLLGLIPENYSYSHCLVESYSHEAAAFYSSDKKIFFLPAWIPASDSVLIHEATHALQDQYFDLNVIDKAPTVIGDKVLAVGALVEGDAMAVETAFRAQFPDQKPPSVDERSQVAAEKGCVLPSPLEDLFYFEYEFGERFIDRIRDRVPLDNLFRSPPSSTREIVHPPVYGTKPLPELAVPRPFPLVLESPVKLQFSEELGEFIVRTLLVQFLGPKSSALAAASLRRDKLALYSETRTSVPVIAWSFRFASEPDQQRFLEAANKWLAARFHFAAPETQSSYFASTGTGAAVALFKHGLDATLTIRAPAITVN